MVLLESQSGDGDIVEKEKARYKLFAKLLEYPSQELIQFLKSSKEFHDPPFPKTLIKFIEEVRQTTLNKLEEIYTITFDLQAICYPYAGYQLFGEDYRRGEFMTKLKEEYRASGFVPPEHELPDHIGVIFQYLSHNPDNQVLKVECLIPVFEKFLDSFRERTDNPYYFLLKAIHESIKSEGHLEMKENFRFVEGGIKYE